MNNNNNNNIWSNLSSNNYIITKSNEQKTKEKPIDILFEENFDNSISNNNNLKETNSSLLNKKTNREKSSNNKGFDLDNINLIDLTFAKGEQRRLKQEKFHDDLIEKITNKFDEIKSKIDNEEILSGLETIVDQTKRIIIRNKKVDILKKRDLEDLCDDVIKLIEDVENVPDYSISKYAEEDDKILAKIFSLKRELEPKKIYTTENKNTLVDEEIQDYIKIISKRYNDKDDEEDYFPEELESFLQEDSDYFKKLPQNTNNTKRFLNATGTNVKPRMFAKFYEDFTKLTKNYFPSGKRTKGKSPEEINLYNTMQDALSYTRDLYRYLNDKGYINKNGNLIDNPDKILIAKIQKHKERLYEPLKALYTALGLQIDPLSAYK